VGQGHLPLDQVAQALSSLALNAAREGAATASLGNLFPVCHHPHCKKFLPYVESKSTLFQFKTVTPCHITAGLAKMTNTGEQQRFQFLCREPTPASSSYPLATSEGTVV